MAISNRRYVIVACILLLLVLVTVIAQERGKPPSRPSDTNQRLPANTTPPINSRDIFRPVPVPSSTPPVDLSPKKTPTPSPTPTPELGCTRCVKNVPFFDLEKEKPALKVRLWESVRTELASGGISVDPTPGGATSIRLSFRNILSPPTGTKYVVWARLPGDEFLPLGELNNVGKDVEVSLTKKLDSNRFGLFVTLESVTKSITPMEKSAVPSSFIVATVEK